MDWYYGDADGQSGPVGEDELAGLIRLGRVNYLTPVWNESMADWARLGEVPELADYLAEAPAHARPPDPDKPRLRVRMPETNLAADPLGRAAPDPRDHFGGVSTHPQKEMWTPGSGRGWTPYGTDPAPIGAPAAGIDLAEALRAPRPEFKFEAAEEPDCPQIRPWARAWARTLDTALFTGVIWLLLLMVAPEAVDTSSTAQELFLQCLFTALTLPIEAFFLASFATTPGKWLHGTWVRSEDGGNLSYAAALNRSFLVWVLGEGLGLPFVGRIAHIVGYYQLTNNDITFWDERCRCDVSHRPIAYKFIAIIAVWFLGGSLFGVVVERVERSRLEKAAEDPESVAPDEGEARPGESEESRAARESQEDFDAIIDQTR